MRAPRIAALSFVAGLASCAGTDRIIEHPSPNQDGRIRFLVIHFTDEDFARSLEVLTAANSPKPVSSHYLVSAPGEPAPVPRVLRLVPESRRAWHAGESEWQGRHGLNDQSIGIEIVYESHCPRGERSPSAGAGEDPHHDPDAGCAYGDYPPAQIAAVTRLAREILARHPDIDPTRVVGHADIAPGRKDDPGPRFPWRALHESGVGAWYDAAEVQRYGARIEQAALSEAGATALLQEGLAAYGYGLESTGVADARTRAVVLAFQSHFLPDRRTGLPDTRTAATALALLARYRPAAAAAIAAKYGVAEGH